MSKKLLIVNTYANMWSTGRIATEIGDVAEKQGWQCYYAYARESRLGDRKGIKITRSIVSYILHTYFFSRILNLKGFGSWVDTWLFIRKVKRISPDLVHLHNIHQNYLHFPLFFSYLKKAGVPVVWTLHDCWVVTGGCTHFVYNRCDNWRRGCYHCPRCGNHDTGGELKGFYRTMPWVLKKKVDCFTSIPRLTFVTVSEWLAGIVKSSALASVPVQVISNGVDTSLFYPREGTRALRQKYGWEDRFVIVGAASYWKEAKGLSDYYRLRSVLPDNKFAIVMVGLSPAQIAGLPEGITGIECTQNIDELALIYSAADVVVSLSYQETFGLTIAEGFACGTPAVVYADTALPELITPQTGLKVAPGNIEQLAEAVMTVCSKGKTFYSQSCISEVVTRYDKNRQYEKYIELYKHILGF